MTDSYLQAIETPCQCAHSGHLLDTTGCGGPRMPVKSGADRGLVMCFACWAANFRPGAMVIPAQGGPRVMDVAAFDRLYLEGSVSNMQAWSAFVHRHDFDHPEGNEEQ